MNKDSKLIYEAYKKNNDVQQIDEAVPVVVGFALKALIPVLAAYISGKTGLTSYVVNLFTRATGIPLQGILDFPVVGWLKILDPTGLTYWPDVEKAIKAYEANPSDENKVEMYTTMFMAIPVVKYLSPALKWAKTGRTGGLGVVLKFFTTTVDNLLKKVFSSSSVKPLITRYWKSYSNQQRRTIVAFFTVMGLRSTIAEMLGLTTSDLDKLANEPSSGDTADATQSSIPGVTQLPDQVRLDIERIRGI